jgi:hypothetical protein
VRLSLVGTRSAPAGTTRSYVVPSEPAKLSEPPAGPSVTLRLDSDPDCPPAPDSPLVPDCPPAPDSPLVPDCPPVADNPLVPDTPPVLVAPPTLPLPARPAFPPVDCEELPDPPLAELLPALVPPPFPLPKVVPPWEPPGEPDPALPPVAARGVSSEPQLMMTNGTSAAWSTR